MEPLQPRRWWTEFPGTDNAVFSKFLSMAVLGELLGVADIDGSLISINTVQTKIGNFCKQDCGKARVKGHGDQHKFIPILIGLSFLMFVDNVDTIIYHILSYIISCIML